jgi:hypothetical protein
MRRGSTDIPLDALDRVRIASPCPARWEDMAGDDRKRFCSQCRLHVYNIAAMTRAEAVALIEGAGKQLPCVQIYRRADGTILTRDCPVGLAAARARLRRTAARVAAALACVIGGAAAAGQLARQTEYSTLRLRAMQPFAALARWLSPAPAPVLTPMPIRGQVALGRVCPTPLAAPSPPTPPPPPGSSSGDSR